MVADGILSGPHSADELLQEALRALQDGRLQDAETLCRTILAASSAHFDALHLLGVVSAQAGRIEPAIELLREGLDINPHSPDAHGNLGELLRRRGAFDAAAGEVETALRLETRTQENLNRLGLIRVAQGKPGEAADCFNAAVALNPDNSDAWHNLGYALDAQGRRSDAIAAYGRALQIKADRADTWCNLGSSRFALGDHTEAIEAFRAAIAIQPDHRPALIGLAKSLDAACSPESLDALRRVAELTPDDPAILAAHGEMSIHWGRFAEAERIFENGLARLGPKPELLYGLTQSKKFSRTDSSLIDDMVVSSRSTDLSAADRGTLHFAIGKALDDLAQYSLAIAHFDEANRSWRVGREFDRKAHRAAVDTMIADFDAATLETWKPFANPSERPIFIVGMPRSGTTLVEQILCRHPEIAPSGENEFWLQRVEALQLGINRRLAPEDVENLAQDYLSLSERNAPGAARIADKMPHNFAWLGLIHGLLPNARIIHCRRHPVDTCLSIYFTRFLHKHHFANDRGDLAAYYQEYSRLMAHWRGIVPADRLLEIDYERLIGDPDREIRRMIEFCGLAWSDSCLETKPPGGPIRTASAWQARQPIYSTSVERWRNYEPWLGELRQLLPSSAPSDRPA